MVRYTRKTGDENEYNMDEKKKWQGRQAAEQEGI